MATSVILSVPQVVDVALGTPEVGTVNFNILQTLLHIIVQSNNLSSTNIEFRGGDAERLTNIISKSKPEGKMNVQEYSIKNAEEKKQDIKGDTVIVVDTMGDSLKTPQVTVAISKNDYLDMQDEISNLKKKLKELSELPGSLGIVQAIKTDKNSPVLDMFHIINLMKRIEAAETSLEKLGTVVEDAIKDMGSEVPRRASVEDTRPEKSQRSTGGASAGGGGGGGEISGPILQELQNLQNRIIECEEKLGISGEDGAPAGAGIGTAMEALKCLDNCSKQTEFVMNEINKHNEQINLIVDGFNNLDPNNMEKSLKDLKNIGASATGVVVATVPAETASVKPRTSDAKSFKSYDHRASVATAGTAAGGPGDSLRLNSLENKVIENMHNLKSLDIQCNTELTTLKAQFTEMEKIFNAILERLNVAAPAEGGGNSDIDTTELYNKTVALQNDLETISEIANKLLQDKEEKQKDMEAFMDQIEFLKTVKADREDLEDALADKADACAVTRKVSHDQFDAACDDLSKGIEEALEKLTQQENLWSQALDDITREIGNKLDKMELGPLRDFVNHKLKVLQERLKALTALKKEQEAAGTKQKLLKDVNCISCDKEVVMRKQIDPSTMPKPYALPPTRSMGPYLAYELDALRKQQKCLPTSKNLHHFESALQGKQESGKDHICNRYCGGSHTVTTPQQRVTRMGHFLTQYGPEVLKCSDGVVKGDDGQVYRADQDYDGKGDGGQPPVTVKAAIVEEEEAAKAATPPDAAEQTRKPSAAPSVKRTSISSARSDKGGEKRPSQTSARSEGGGSGEKRASTGSAKRGSKDSKRISMSSRKSGSKRASTGSKVGEPATPTAEGENAEIPPIKEEEEPEAGKEEGQGSPEGAPEEAPAEEAPADQGEAPPPAEEGAPEAVATEEAPPAEG